MTANIQIPDLTPAGPINSATDLIVLRQGLEDRKATVSQISQIVFSDYTISGTPLTSTDVLVFGKNNGDGTYSNFALRPQALGFLSGTNCWFYQATAPLGWQIVPNTGDRVLGTVLAGGGLLQYNTAGLQGTWQQRDVDGITNTGLSIDQIPNHQHWGQFGKDRSDSNAKFIAGARSLPSTSDPRYSTNTNLGIVGGLGDPGSHDAFGACNPHNHGSNWRPSACVGLICTKIL